MNQMISQVDNNVAQKYFKVTNHGWYIAYFEVQYTLQGQMNNIDSGTFSLGMAKKVFIPEGAEDVTIKISVAVGINWTNIESKFSKVMETSCFTLYGTLFTPYALEVNCTGQLGLENGNGSSGNNNPCCCCNCSNMCKSIMSMEEYQKYLKKFYEKNGV